MKNTVITPDYREKIKANGIYESKCSPVTNFVKLKKFYYNDNAKSGIPDINDVRALY